MLSKIRPVVSDLGLTMIGDISSPNEGRIAKNFIVCTQEAGDILVRLRPLQAIKSDALLEYGPERFEFEARVIDFLYNAGLPVPHLLSFRSTGTTLLKSGDFYAFSYPLLSGHPIAMDDIDTEIARNVGELTNRLVQAATTYQPTGQEPDGDIDYINRILRASVAASSPSGGQPEVQAMFDHLNNARQRQALELTPSGIVHGDLFFENVIQHGRDIVGLIDFGDAYYGNVLMDIATASMEFSVNGGEWDDNRFSNFLSPLATWLAANQIAASTFHYSLLANCVRFAAHTHSLALAGGSKPVLRDNAYVQRFFNFRDDLSTDLLSAYEMILQSASPGSGSA